MSEGRGNSQGGTGAISEELDRLSCDLLGQALDAFAAGIELTSVVAVEDEAGAVSSCAFEDDGPEECLEAARAYVRRVARDGGDRPAGLGRPVRYALVYDGDVADESGAYAPALILEFGERGQEVAFTGFVLYDGFGRGEGFSWSDAQAAGETEPLL
ncbi:MAG: hypothetical protein LKE37_02900 [Atopobiaceae bacterium]|jgi:hypothetical protein|nr:hypothetical protein [Atopobiaceae bacterium]